MQTLVFWPNVDAGSEDVAKGIRDLPRARPGARLPLLPQPAAGGVRQADGALRRAWSATPPRRCARGRSSARRPSPSARGSRAASTGRTSSRSTTTATEIADAIRDQIAHGPYERSHLFGDGTAGRQIADRLAEVRPQVQKRLCSLSVAGVAGRRDRRRLAALARSIASASSGPGGPVEPARADEALEEPPSRVRERIVGERAPRAGPTCVVERSARAGRSRPPRRAGSGSGRSPPGPGAQVARLDGQHGSADDRRLDLGARVQADDGVAREDLVVEVLRAVADDRRRRRRRRPARCQSAQASLSTVPGCGRTSRFASRARVRRAQRGDPALDELGLARRDEGGRAEVEHGLPGRVEAELGAAATPGRPTADRSNIESKRTAPVTTTVRAGSRAAPPPPAPARRSRRTAGRAARGQALAGEVVPAVHDEAGRDAEARRPP